MVKNSFPLPWVWPQKADSAKEWLPKHHEMKTAINKFTLYLPSNLYVGKFVFFPVQEPFLSIRSSMAEINTIPPLNSNPLPVQPKAMWTKYNFNLNWVHFNGMTSTGKLRGYTAIVFPLLVNELILAHSLDCSLLSWVTFCEALIRASGSTFFPRKYRTKLSSVWNWVDNQLDWGYVGIWLRGY